MRDRVERNCRYWAKVASFDTSPELVIRALVEVWSCVRKWCFATSKPFKSELSKSSFNLISISAAVAIAGNDAPDPNKKFMCPDWSALVSVVSHSLCFDVVETVRAI